MQGKVVGSYKVGVPLGLGVLSEVYSAQHIRTMRIVAMRRVPKAHLKGAHDLDVLQGETSLMARMDHPFLVTFYEVAECAENYYIVFEMVEGERLWDHIRSRGELTEDEARTIFAQVIIALEYLHMEQRCCLLNLCAEGVMLDAAGVIRIVDFRNARVFTAENPRLQFPRGPIAYMAPEMFQERPYTAAVDVWAAGVLLYTMVCGVLPFWDESPNILQEMVVSGLLRFPRNLSTELTHLLGGLLEKNQCKRMKLCDVRRHRWLADADAFGGWPSSFMVRMRICHMPALDDSVVAQMRELGVGLDGLQEEVASCRVNPRTSVYRQLRRGAVDTELAAYAHTRHWTMQRRHGPAASDQGTLAA